MPNLGELAAVLREVRTDRLRLLADWLDITDRPGQSSEAQTDLRSWADRIDDVVGRLP